MYCEEAEGEEEKVNDVAVCLCVRACVGVRVFSRCQFHLKLKQKTSAKTAQIAVAFCLLLLLFACFAFS